MKISLFNQKIKIQVNKVVVDKYGNHYNSFVDFYSCFAYTTSKTGKEVDDVSPTHTNQSVSFTIRYAKKIANINSLNYRIIFNDEAYNIKSIDYPNFKKSIKLVCKKEVYEQSTN